MRRQLIWLLLAMLAPNLVVGCAGVDYVSVAHSGLKVAGKAVEASRPISDSEEYYVGRAVAARVLSTYPLYQDTQLTLYVNEVGQAVARKSSRPNPYRGYHFAVLDTTEINAFACPGGIIFITRGLLKTCANEDELAAVLAHEVGHVANKDGINSISKARWTEVLTTAGTEAAKQFAGPAGSLVTLFEGSIDDVFKTIVVNGYSRSAEAAADQDAVNTLSRAGYDPGAMAALLTKMAAMDKGSGGIFKTHPPTSERLAKVKAQVTEGLASKEMTIRIKRFQSQKL